MPPESELPQGGLIAVVDGNAMYTTRTLEGSTLEEMLMPPFRSIKFDQYAAMIYVSTSLRAAWVAEPSPDGLDSWQQSYLRGDRSTSKNPDLSTLHTPWRDQIYNNWNHVFYDGYNFLSEAACGIGGFHPPSHDILSLYSQPQGPVEQVWNTNVILVPAYIAPGVRVRMFKAEEDEEGNRKEFGMFDEENTMELWFLMRETKVLFQVEEETEAAREGPAVVLAVGIGCNGNCPEQEKAEVETEEETVKEIQSGDGEK